LILAWQIKAKNVLVVGGGEVAAGRILNLLNADANVTVVCPRSGLNAEVLHRVTTHQVHHVDRVFLPLDLEPSKNIAMVLTAVDDPDASTRIWKYCKKLKIPANIADVPPECDFYFGSIHRDGPLQIMVSTNGNGPRIAASIRKKIGETLPKGIGESIRKVGMLRRKLRKVAPGKGTEDISKRMAWMSEVCDKWSVDNFNSMDDEDMRNLIQYYEPGIVPSFEEVKGNVVWEFDGSFGWI